MHRFWMTTVLAIVGAAMPFTSWAQTVVEPVETDTRNVGDTLQTVMASVYRGNPQLLAERARLREIDENYVQARAQGRPSLSAGGDISYQAVQSPDSDNPFIPTSDGFIETQPRSAQISVVQPLYQGGRVRALKQQAKAGILAARASLEATENAVFLSAAQAYVDVMRDEDIASIRRNNVRVLSRQLEAAQVRFEVGEGTRTDIAQSESRLAAAEAGLALSDAQTEISRAAFVRVVGRMPDQLSPVPSFVVPATLDKAITLARAGNPQLTAAYYNEAAGRAAVNVAKAAGRPTVSLQSSVARSRGSFQGFQDQDQITVGANIRVPIYSGGANRSRVRQARTAQTRLGFETRDAERAVDEAVRQVWAQMQAATRIVDTSRRQVTAAGTAFEGVKLEQEVGTRTQLDVLDAEQETLDASLNLLSAERDYDAAVFALLSVLGVLDADGLNLPVARYDVDANFEAVARDGFARGLDSVTLGQLENDARITLSNEGFVTDADAERSTSDAD